MANDTLPPPPITSPLLHLLDDPHLPDLLVLPVQISLLVTTLRSLLRLAHTLDLLHVLDQPALPVPLLALPAGEEVLAEFEARERVRFRVEDHFVKWQDVVGPEEQVQILESLGLHHSQHQHRLRYVRVGKRGKKVNLPARNSPCCPYYSSRSHRSHC